MGKNKKPSKFDFRIGKLDNGANKQQAKASDPTHSVWVEASAGTGKTKVLSDRVLKLLLGGVAPSKILCLTYTKAAAAEMKTRVADRLSKWAVIPEEELEKELGELYYGQDILQKDDEKKRNLLLKARKLFAEALDALDQMRIETIHAFCTEILKRFPLEAGISPYFEVAEEQATKEMLDSVSQRLLAVIEENSDPNIKEATLYLTSHIKELKWQEFLKDIVSNRRFFLKMFQDCDSEEAFKAKLRQRLKLNDEPNKENYIQKFWEETDFVTLKNMAAHLIEEGGIKDSKRGVRLLEDFEKYDFDDYFDCLVRDENGYEPRPQLVCQPVAKKYPEIELALKEEALRLIKAYKYLQNIDIYESTLAVSKVALKLIEDYAACKREHSCMDFDDLIMTTCRLFEKDVSAWVLYKLDNGLDHILIDEAQDTSPLAWQIIDQLASEFFAGSGQKDGRTLFVVGDRKQSIYGFQGADPKIFNKMREKYEQNVSPVDLRVSFRSTRAVLRTVNKLFSDVDAQKGITDNGGKVKHLAYRLGEGGLVEVWPIIDKDKETAPRDWKVPLQIEEKVSPDTMLAVEVANKIKTMVSNKEILASKGRPVRYSDFMVLVRKRGDFMDEFVKAAKKLDVNITGVDRLSLKNEIAVEDLCALSEFLLLPQDNLSLASVLRSPLYGLSEEDLFELCYERGYQTLWERLKESDKFEQPKKELSTLLAKVQILRPFELFDMVLNTFEGRKRFHARLGEEAKDAIDEFMNLTLKFEASHVPNLQNFMTWFKENEIEVKRELEQATTDAVRLMTVHKSKGLQAPIVILPDATHLVKTKRERKLLFDEDVFYYPLSAAYYNDNCTGAHEAKIEEDINEEHRLLYVAATRAEDRLYVVGKKTSDKQKTWYDFFEQTLKELQAADENGVLKFEMPQEIEPEDEEDKKARKDENAHDISWLNKPVPTEETVLKKYNPSHAEDGTDDAVSSPLSTDLHGFRRGILIHKLLQMLPRFCSFDKMADMIKAYLAKQTDLDAHLKESVEKEVLNVLSNKDFAFIFEGDSKAEVPVMGVLGENVVSGQIDRLVVLEDKVLIVDFKTNRPAAETLADVSDKYKAQLDIYAKLIEQIYPNKAIEKYILWTNTLKLMKI